MGALRKSSRSLSHLLMSSCSTKLAIRNSNRHKSCNEHVVTSGASARDACCTIYDPFRARAWLFASAILWNTTELERYTSRRCLRVCGIRMKSDVNTALVRCFHKRAKTHTYTADRLSPRPVFTIDRCNSSPAADPSLLSRLHQRTLFTVHCIVVLAIDEKNVFYIYGPGSLEPACLRRPDNNLLLK